MDAFAEEEEEEDRGNLSMKRLEALKAIVNDGFAKFLAFEEDEKNYKRDHPKLYSRDVKNREAQKLFSEGAFHIRKSIGSAERNAKK